MLECVITVFILLGQFGEVKPDLPAMMDSFFLLEPPEPKPFVPDAPLPEHIDIESLLDKLTPIEPNLIWTIGEMKGFTWGVNTHSVYKKSLYLKIEGGSVSRNTVTFTFLDKRLLGIFFLSLELLREPDNPAIPIEQSEFYYLVQDIIDIFDLDVEISLEDCQLMPTYSEENDWVARRRFEVAAVPYDDCRFYVILNPKLNVIKEIMLDIPNKPPPELTPVLNQEEAVQRALSVAYASGYFLVPRRNQIILFKEPELRIVNSPWTLAHFSIQQSREDWFIMPTVSWKAPELRSARLYWSVPLYANHKFRTNVKHLMIDAITGDLLHTYHSAHYSGEIDPNIPPVNEWEYAFYFLFPYWFPIVFTFILLTVYSGRFLYRRIHTYYVS